MSSLATNIISPAGVSTEANLGTLTWSAGVAPSGSISKTYRCITNGKAITFLAKITASVAGTAVISVSFPLPADVPNPSTWAVQSTSGLVTTGTGTMTADITGTPLGVSAIYEDGAGGYVVKIIVAAVAATNASCVLTWIRS